MGETIRPEIFNFSDDEILALYLTDIGRQPTGDLEIALSSASKKIENEGLDSDEIAAMMVAWHGLVLEANSDVIENAPFQK